MQASRKRADVTKRMVLKGNGRMAHLGLTPCDGSAILRGIHPPPLGEETQAMAMLADYAEKYQTIHMERRDGILQNLTDILAGFRPVRTTMGLEVCSCF